MRLRRLLGASALAGLALAGAAFGSGYAHLVITSGVSMQPVYTEGDLVIVAEKPSYAVGDIAAFPKPDTEGTLVLHRIIGGDADSGLVFQGDNNPSIDPVQPRGDELVGEAVLHLPRGGIWLRRLVSPPALAAMAFLLLAGGGAAAQTRRQRKKERRPVSARHSARSRPSTGVLPPPLLPVAAGAAGVGLLGLALSGVAWTRAAETTVAASTSATSTMDFSYVAQVPQTPAYDGTTVTSPQPVFRALTDRVDVTYRYQGLPGSLSVDAELSAASGWRSTLPLAAAAPVGAQHEGTVTLDLTELEERAAQGATAIGIPAAGIAVAVVPSVALEGGGTFTPRLELSLDPKSLRTTGELTATEATSTDGTRTEPARLSLLGRSLDVATARTAGPVAVLLAVLAGLVLAALARLSGPVSEAERVKQRYGDLVLPVMPIALASGRPLVDVPDVESLVKLAERYGLLVLSWSRGGVDTYVVQDESTTYRYRTGGAPAAAPAPAPAPEPPPAPEPAPEPAPHAVAALPPCGDVLPGR